LRKSSPTPVIPGAFIIRNVTGLRAGDHDRRTNKPRINNKNPGEEGVLGAGGTREEKKGLKPDALLAQKPDRISKTGRISWKKRKKQKGRRRKKSGKRTRKKRGV